MYKLAIINGNDINVLSEYEILADAKSAISHMPNPSEGTLAIVVLDNNGNVTAIY